MSTGVMAFAAALALAVVPTLVPTGAAHAQTSRGAVSGTVRDPAGDAIHGATIVLTNTETGVRRSTPSNEAGIYQFDAVGPRRLTNSRSHIAASSPTSPPNSV